MEVSRIAGPILAIALAGCAASTVPAPDAAAILAPTGKLRIGLYPGSPTSILRDADGSNPRGVAYDAGASLAKRLAVPFEPVVFPANDKLMEAAKAGSVDLVFTNASASRARFLDFTPTVLEVEKGYLVPPRSSIAEASGVDRPGVRVGVSRGSSSQAELARELRRATLVPVPALRDAAAMLSDGRLEAFATNKAILSRMAQGLPGSRVLEGRWGVEKFAFGIPKGRGAAIAELTRMLRQARSDGDIAAAVARAGLQGVAVAVDEGR